MHTSNSFATSILHQIASVQPKGFAKVVLKKGKTQLFKDGSPMVYSGAVDRIIGRPPPKTGDIVLVADGTEKPIGWGLYNSFSMFQVRMMQLADEVSSDPYSALNMEKLLERRIASAIDLRRRLNLPSVDTNTYRLINSEGDRLSGLIVDVFGDLAVVASSAAWVEKYRSIIEGIISRIEEIKFINWRPSMEMLQEEGMKSSDLMTFPLPDLPEKIKVMENGITYAISAEGQKTGFYADQRENRKFISSISKGKKVLDLFCYSGGFSLNAAHGGATEITGVDSSLQAVELARENISLNSLDPDRVSFIREDASEFMKSALLRSETWDIVVLDPPKLAPRRKDLHKASGMYRNLNAMALKLIKQGGFLMTCSCSGAMTQSGTFSRVLQARLDHLCSFFTKPVQISNPVVVSQGAAAMAGKRITVLRQSGAASDHTIDPSYPEGQYLSNVLIRVV